MVEIYDKESVIVAMKLVAHTQQRCLTVKDCPKLQQSSLSMIKELLSEKSCTNIACWQDAKGLTPLLQAAMLINQFHSLKVIEAILNHCPQSVEVCDNSGNTILHILMNKELRVEGRYEYIRQWLDIPELITLKNRQDFAGNTPAHIAVRNQDVDMVHFLLGSSANLAIKNQEGVSVADLILRQPDFRSLLKLKPNQILPPNMIKYLNQEDIDAAERADMGYLTERIKEPAMDFLRSRHPNDGGNILHSLVKGYFNDNTKETDFKKFIIDALKQEAFLICQTDANGNNPLHTIALFAPEIINKDLLAMYEERFQQVLEETGTEGLYYPPWRAKNIYGDTPLHVALKRYENSKYEDIISSSKVLLEFDEELAEYVNLDGRTPLHLLCGIRRLPNNLLRNIANARYEGEPDIKEVKNVRFIITKSLQVINKADKDGLTPILEASRVHNLVVLMILRLVFGMTDSLNLDLVDNNGQSFLHLIAQTEASGAENYYDELNEIKTLFNQKVEFYDAFYKQNKDGNTALHLAIENCNFKFAKFCFESIAGNINKETILTKCNVNGETFLHLTAMNTGVSRDYESALKEVETVFANSGGLFTAFCKQDKDGNTALHLAIEKRNFQFAKFCIEYTVGSQTGNILDRRNAKNISPGDLIGSADDLPYEFERFLWRKPQVVEDMLGVRSLSGIPTTMIKDYINTLGVTAALLATITFTAAFTVPGGLKREWNSSSHERLSI